MKKNRSSADILLAQLRRKFVTTTMLFAVFVLAIICIVACTTRYSLSVNETYSSLQHEVNRVDRSNESSVDAATHASSVDVADIQESSDSETSHPSRRPSSEDQTIAVAIYSVDERGHLVSVFEDALSLSADDAQAAVCAALRQAGAVDHADSPSSAHGFLDGYDLYFHVGTVDDGYDVAFISGKYVKQDCLGTLWSFLGGSFVALLLFFPLSLLLSKRALLPTQRAWEQQRRFIADASHELKTPLSVIKANDAIIMSHPKSSVSEQMKWIENTELEVATMERLVNDMLMLATLDSGKRIQSKTKVDFSAVVKAKGLEFESLAFDRGITLDTSAQAHVFVEGESRYLERLASTLIDNAIKYCDDGGSVDVSLKVVEAHAVFAVRNSAAEITRTDLENVFERFYRHDSARTRGTGGFGLGLSIVRRIAEEYEGSIDADAHDGFVIFTAKLPIV